VRLPQGVQTRLRHADRWRVEQMLREQPKLDCEDQERDLGLWLRLFEPDDLVRIGQEICEAAAARPDEMSWGCTWGRDGVSKSAVAYSVSARELLRDVLLAEEMTRREACEAVIGRMWARNIPILLVVDDGEEGLEMWIDSVVSDSPQLVLPGRCPGGRNTRTSRAHRVLWAYHGLWEPWGTEEWRGTHRDSAANWLDRCVERMTGHTPEKSARWAST
jgi:hypothetical protein